MAPALRAERRRTLRHALPLIGAQLLAVGNGLVDTLVAGRLNPESLASVGIGANILFIIIIAGTGLLAGLSPLMAQHIGRRESLAVGDLFRQGLWLATLLGVLGWTLLTLLREHIGVLGLDPALSPLVAIYLDAARWCVLPALLLMVPRNVCEASGQTRPVLIIQGLGLLLNIVSDLGLGLGWFGLPMLGLEGIAWSTTLVNLGMCIGLFLAVQSPRFRRYSLTQPLIDAPNAERLRRLLGLSLPICLTILFETGLFAVTSLLMGTIGTVPASAHNIALTTAAFLFMMPLGLSFALTARLGVALGRERPDSIRLRVANGLTIAVVMALVSATLLLALRHWLPTLFTADPEVRAMATSFLLFAMFFQFSDALQVVLIGLLRGLQDTRVPMFINGFAYWVVGLGVALLTTFHLDISPHGLWIGLIAGLSTSAVLLSLRLRHRLSRLEGDQSHN